MQHERAALPAGQTAGAELAARYRLPVPLTSLVGREREVAEICSLLRRPSVRLMTLVGTGGVGKTRLGLAVAQELWDDFADGVCFVPLAPVSEPARVMVAIAQELDLWEVSELPLEVQVQAAFRERHMLLLLDNFEQVIEAASQLASLLACCPLLSILVTSRAALRLSGEQEFPVLPLAVPNLEQVAEPGTLAQVAAVRLFVMRAQAVQPTFQLTTSNASVVAAICAKLEGLPLAIELAAARIKLLPPAALLKRLSRRLDVLTSGASDLPLRQRTLRNAIQWSYDLLNREEQRLFRWLSIFVGGCSLEGVEVVCQGGKEQAPAVLDTLASLVDKSLIQQTAHEGEEPRFVMLETVREFGLACLEQHGELEAARHAHTHYYLALAEQAEPHLIGPEEFLWLNRLNRELDNVRVILQTATGDEEVELALRLASTLRFFWDGMGYLREGRGVLERLLARAEVIAAPIHLKALIAIGELMWLQDDAQELGKIADGALALARELGDRVHMTNALILRGAAIMLSEGDYAEAQAWLEEALAEARALGDRLVLITALVNLGRLALFQRDHPRAVTVLEECLARCRAMGDKTALCVVLVLLARAELNRDNAGRARALLEESLSTLRAFGNTLGVR